jgi:competence protein ComGC
MRKLCVLFAFIFICNLASAAVPWFNDTAIHLNVHTAKVIDGFYKRLKNIEGMQTVINDFNNIFKTNLGLNPEKDIKNAGLVIVFINNKPNMFAYAEGNFAPKKALREIKTTVEFMPQAANKKIKFDKIANKQIIKFIDKKKNRTIAACFHSDNLLYISEEAMIEKLLKGKFKTSNSMPDTIKKELGSDFFLWLNTGSVKKAVQQIPNPVVLPVVGILGMFESAALAIETNDLRFYFNCINKETASNLKTFIEGQIAGYRMFIDSQLKNQKLELTDKKWMVKAFTYLLKNSMALMAKKSLEKTSLKSIKNQVSLTTTIPPFFETALNPVTIGTIGVAAAIAIPNFQKARKKAQERICVANQHNINGAIEMYNIDHDKPFASLDGNNLEILVEENYLKSIPECPGGGKYYFTDDGRVKCTKHGGFINKPVYSE